MPQRVHLPHYVVTQRVRMLAESLDYNHKLFNTPVIWKKTKGAGVKLAVLDTGVPRHVDLKPADAAHTKSFVPNYLVDTQGHSTHCAGIISAIAGNGMGVAGIAPDLEMYYVAVLDGDGSGEMEWIADGIRWAADQGVDIISMSLGADAVPLSYKLRDACDYAYGRGVTIVAASGNEAGAVCQPASYESVIAVAAVNSRKQHADFSNFGPEIDFAAGGVDVFSTYLDNSYAKLSGTSMATPALAAAAALIVSEHRVRGVKLTPDEVKEHLTRIAFDVGPGGYDDLTGVGIPLFTNYGDGETDHEPVPVPVPGPDPAPDPDVVIPWPPRRRTKKAGFDPDCVHWQLALRVFSGLDADIRAGKVKSKDAFAEFLARASKYMNSVTTRARAAARKPWRLW